MAALYLLAQEYREAADRLADMDLDETTIADTLESLSGDLDLKATNVAMFARNLEATAEQIKAAEAQMEARRKTLERRASNLRTYLLASMRTAGVTSIACPHFALTVRENPPAVDVFDAAQVPAEFMRQPEAPPPEPAKADIKRALQQGRDVAGCRLTTNYRLEIK